MQARGPTHEAEVAYYISILALMRMLADPGH